MKKLLLTGATGLIGSEVITLLKNTNYKVYALSRKEHASVENIEYIKADIFDNGNLSKIFSKVAPDYFLHLAWDSTGYFNSNINFDYITATLNLLKLFKQYGGNRVVMAGSYAEYGEQTSPLNERMHPQPITLYAKCKVFSYQISKEFCLNNDISFGWARIFSAFGNERDPRRLTKYVIDSLLQNKEITINSGSLIRDYIYSKDVAAALLAFLESDVNDIVNICTGKGTSIHDYVMKIASYFRKENLVNFSEKDSNQQTCVIGDIGNLKNYVMFLPKYTIDDAIVDICYNLNSQT